MIAVSSTGWTVPWTACGRIYESMRRSDLLIKRPDPPILQARRRSRNGRRSDEQSIMDAPVRDIDELELALLRRGIDALAAGREQCDHCHRTPLIGERVYVYESDAVLCELCRALERQPPAASRIVHGPEFGHTMRITDRRHAA